MRTDLEGFKISLTMSPYVEKVINEGVLEIEDGTFDLGLLAMNVSIHAAHVAQATGRPDLVAHTLRAYADAIESGDLLAIAPDQFTATDTRIETREITVKV
jgi:hypothetical protein